MCDEADFAEERSAYLVDVGLRANSSLVAKIQPGVPGECDKCGEDKPRLVNGICCKCRDKWKLG
jgi:hypothetical protein